MTNARKMKEFIPGVSLPWCDYCEEDLYEWYDAMTKDGKERRCMCPKCYELHGDKTADNDHYLKGNDRSYHLVTGAIH